MHTVWYTVFNCFLDQIYPCFSSLCNCIRRNTPNLELFNVFYFLSTFISDLEKAFKNFPKEYEDTFPPLKVCKNPVWYEKLKKQDYASNTNLKNTSPKPCAHCTYKEFNNVRYTMSKCRVKKLSSSEILKITDETRPCPRCGSPKMCTIICMQNEYLLHHCCL